MRGSRTMGVFVSGCLVYVIMAACSSMPGTGPSGSGGKAGATASGPGGQGGQGGVSGAGGDSGIFDALLDPVPNADANTMSGTRLKKRYLLADDGTREDLPGWHDSQRQEDCAFALGGDGMQRCLPKQSVVWSGFYADAQCAIGIVNISVPPVQCNFTPPKYATLTIRDMCTNEPTENHVYLLAGPANVQTPTPIFVMVNGVCTFTATQNSTAPWYKIGAEVDAASFVAAAPMVDP